LLPAGHREGAEWRCGSVAGEPGHSLGIHLTGDKAGVWSDFSGGGNGDALDLIAAVLGKSLGGAIAWSRRWLGIDEGRAELQRRSPAPKCSDFWRGPWQASRPISGTLAERYLASRNLRFVDPQGRILRFTERHARRNSGGEIEHHPAMLALLRDVHTGRAGGLINVYLRSDGSDRLRDLKGKTTWGRAAGSAVMLSGFDGPVHGLTICEGVETGIGLLMAGLAPVWCCGGAGNLASFPVLSGIECLTVAGDADKPGRRAAAIAAERWRNAGREVAIVAPPIGDWADHAA